MNILARKDIAIEFIQDYTSLDYVKKDSSGPKTFFIITKSEPMFNYEQIMFEATVYLDTDEEFRKLFDMGFDKKIRKLGFGITGKYFDEERKEGYFILDTIIC